jgi:hypothetical protein
MTACVSNHRQRKKARQKGERQNIQKHETFLNKNPAYTQRAAGPISGVSRN